MTYTAHVSSKGQVVIPSSIRKKIFSAKQRTCSISFDELNQTITIKPAADIFSLKGTIKHPQKLGPLDTRKLREQFEASQPDI